MNNFDITVIGGGASGLCFAISLAKQNPLLKIAVLEALDRVGKKLALTGNGQCNISNKNLNLERFHSNNTNFANNALTKFGFAETKDFFSAIGVEIVCKEDGRAYPRSFQASSVVDALRFEAETLGINVFYNCRVNGVKKKNNLFNIESEQEKFSSKYVVLATGLLSGADKVGSFGDGVRILESLGHKRVKMTPAIVQLKAENPFLRRLKGIKTDAVASLYIGGKLFRTESGEVLFTEYGLSGPPILQLSRETARDNKNCEIAVDLMPELSNEELIKLLFKRRECLKARNKEHFLTCLLQNRLAQTLLVACNIELSEKIELLSDSEIKLIAQTIKGFKFKVTGNTGFIHSQVTAGGINVDDFDSRSMQSKIVKGLFALGELLDIDGDCGGFNLAWCWASALTAAEYIAEETK